MARNDPTLRRDDILAAVKYLVDLKNGTDATKRVDDIDQSLGQGDDIAFECGPRGDWPIRAMTVRVEQVVGR